MKVVFETDATGHVATRFEEAETLREAALRTGASEASFRRGMEWAAVNRAIDAEAMVAECIQHGGGGVDYVIGMRTDRYEVDLTGVEVRPGDECSFLHDIVRINPGERASDVFYRLLHDKADNQTAGVGEGVAST